MDIEEIQCDFSVMLPSEHRLIVRLLLKNNYKTNHKNYQDYDYFSYCKNTNEFKFYKNKVKDKKVINYKQFKNIFKIKKLKEQIKKLENE